MLTEVVIITGVCIWYRGFGPAWCKIKDEIIRVVALQCRWNTNTTNFKTWENITPLLSNTVWVNRNRRCRRCHANGSQCFDDECQSCNTPYHTDRSSCRLGDVCNGADRNKLPQLVYLSVSGSIFGPAAQQSMPYVRPLLHSLRIGQLFTSFWNVCWFWKQSTYPAGPIVL